MSSIKIAITSNFTEVYELTEGISIGRSKENDIVLLGDSVSRNHVRIYPDDKEFVIEDLNSANGLYVNGERVLLRALQQGDVIEIGGNKIHYCAEIWDNPPKVVDLMKHSWGDYQLSDIILAPDVLFVFPSNNKNIQEIYDIADQKFALLDMLSITEKSNLDAMLREAVGNAQRHGHKYLEHLPIEFRFIRRRDRLIMRITDQGEGFDYRSELRRGSKICPIEAARNRFLSGGYGGLGIIMMLRGIDKVDYNRKGNQVTLTKYLQKCCVNS